MKEKNKETLGGQDIAPEKTVIEAQQVIYIGPNLLREGLQRYQIFKGLPKDRFASLQEKYPHIARLFVNVDVLGAALEDVKKKGTPLFLSYNEILEVNA